MENNRLKVSFIIPNWNHKQLLFECISSIISTTRDVPHEVIVVDNASSDGSSEYIKQQFPDVIWVQNDLNLGYAKAVNRGVKQSRGNYIFLLNNDVALIENASDRLIKFIRETRSAGAVAPALYYPDGRFQISCRRFPTPLSLFLEFFGIDRIGPFHRWKLQAEEHVQGIIQQPMASALLVKRECWDTVGPMDEDFPIFFNDVDWCYRLYKHTNYKIYFCPDAKVVHHHGASVKRLGFRKRVEFLRGLFKFYLKHFPVI